MSPAKGPEPPGWVGPLLNMPVHPFAARFPMLSDVELKELADDIKAHGLHQALVLDPEGQLLDGRNRLAACNLAGVAPTLRTWGGDPVDYILGANLHRRHLSQGQKAMLTVLGTLPRLGVQSLDSVRELAQAHDVSKSLLGYARIVYDYAPELVDAVVTGEKALDIAYGTAREQKTAKESAAGQRATLEEEAPDLLQVVQDEKLTLSEAMGALKERREFLRKERVAATRNLAFVVDLLDLPRFTDEEALHALTDHLAVKELPAPRPVLSAERLARAARHLSYVAEHYRPPEENGHGT